jgi:uncharacterized protein (DUF305 family)
MKNILKLIRAATLTTLTLSIGSSLAQGMGNMQMGNSSMDMGNMKSMKALEQASGKTFDIYWMSQMIAHHNTAVQMANGVLKNGKDAKTKQAAQDVVRAQSAEIKQMTHWLKSWYNTKPNAMQMQMMNTDMKPMLLASMGGMEGMMMGNADRNFLENMVPHHQSAVDMAKLALTKAVRPELKTFARGVIAMQSKEITQYQMWLKTMK